MRHDDPKADLAGMGRVVGSCDARDRPDAVDVPILPVDDFS